MGGVTAGKAWGGDGRYGRARRRRRRNRVALVFVFALVLVAVPLALAAPDYIKRLTHPLEYEAQIQASAAEYGVEPTLVAAVIRTESRFDPEASSSRGANGLMQLQSDTAAFVSERGGIAGDYTEPETNIRMGTWYLRYLMDRYGDERLALAAYNSGPTRVDRWTSREGFDVGRDIPFTETRDYVVNVQESRGIYTELYGANLEGSET